MGGNVKRALSWGPADVSLCRDYQSLGYRLKGVPIPEAGGLSLETASVRPARGVGLPQVVAIVCDRIPLADSFAAGGAR